jgi:hypothetical protein
MAASAEHSDAAEDLRRPLNRVIGVLAYREEGACRIVCRSAAGGENLAAEFVERHVRRNGVPQELAEQEHSRRAHRVAAVLKEVAPLQRPVIDELRPL